MSELVQIQVITVLAAIIPAILLYFTRRHEAKLGLAKDDLKEQNIRRRERSKRMEARIETVRKSREAIVLNEGIARSLGNPTLDVRANLQTAYATMLCVKSDRVRDAAKTVDQSSLPLEKRIEAIDEGLKAMADILWAWDKGDEEDG